MFHAIGKILAVFRAQQQFIDTPAKGFFLAVAVQAFAAVVPVQNAALRVVALYGDIADFIENAAEAVLADLERFQRLACGADIDKGDHDFLDDSLRILDRRRIGAVPAGRIDIAAVDLHHQVVDRLPGTQHAMVGEFRRFHWPAVLVAHLPVWIEQAA